jgi:hypothetical protein
VVIRRWSPPVKKTPVAAVSSAGTLASLASARVDNRSGRTDPAPARAKSST